MTDLSPPKFGLGAPIRRLEDKALITGQGRYTDDIRPEGVLSAYLVRSAAAHAGLSVDGVEAARAAPGVHLVWTAADVADLKPLPCQAKGPVKGPFHDPTQPILVSDIVRHVGDAVAFIVADSVEAAKDAAEHLQIAYADLPAVIDMERAAADGADLVHAEFGTNVSFRYEVGDKTATDAAFAKADKVARLRVVNNRVVSNYMETRAALAEFDAATGHFTFTVGSQGVHGIKDQLVQSLGIKSSALTVRSFDVGGGFGTKAFIYREYPLVAKAAMQLKRPVRWTSERTEHFLSCAQGRDNIADAALALDRDGRILALRIDLLADMGAYLSSNGPFIPWLGFTMATGVYDIQAIHLQCRGVFTNTVPTDAYRGAGRPEAAYLIERLAEEGARVSGLPSTEFRRRNMIRPDQMPYRTAMRRIYDTGDFAGTMDAALEAADRAGFEARAEEAKKRGFWRGFGFATYVEACAFPGEESARIILDTDGGVTVHVGTQSNGQGHQTAYAQFVAGPLGLPYDRIRVVQGDSDALKDGGGTGGSRSIPLGVPAVDKAAETLARTLKSLAADELEAAAADIVLEDGRATVVGTDRGVSFADLAAKASARIEETERFKSDQPTYPNGTHVCEVEIDPDTGSVHVKRYTIVDDFGRVVNPLLLAGQVHGGVMQGIGQALCEHTVYDEGGQLVTATYNDYAMPRAWDAPFFDFETRNIPSEHNPLGIKGAGEAGTIGAAPAVMNAVVDALQRGAGITHIDMPATPLRVWDAIHAAGGGA